MKTNGRIEGRWERIKRMWNVGIYVLFAVVALTLGKDKLFSAFSGEGLNNIPVTQLSVLLLLTSIILVFRWLQAVNSEYQLLYDYLKEYLVNIPKPTFSVIIGLAALGGSLIYFSTDLLIYTCIFVCFKLFEIWGLWIRDSKTKESLNLAREKAKPEDSRRAIWDAVDKYYLVKPQTPLAISVMFFSFIALILSILGRIYFNDVYGTWLMSSGYIVMLLNILISEIIFSKWRKERNQFISEDY